MQIHVNPLVPESLQKPLSKGFKDGSYVLFALDGRQRQLLII